ncbi:MAG: ribosome biogenesis GTP-binding protein YihA/YsxC [Bacillota bacterium]|nr:ribosome biogenesis GTP-binding protein YihA/YsxC [Bacillota bacterium]MDW7683342.1 ribosome biogenesis GTP-binding protein YihA/YsxC [Bacillota bacterium]
MKIGSAQFVISAAAASQFPTENLPEVAFVGRSNVGKSSLLNALVNRKKLALTSGSPGKTRLVNFFLINDSFMFADLPGYGFARVSQDMKKQWGLLIEEYLRTREPLRLVAQLVDVRHPPSADDLAMYRWLVHYNIPTVIVATKADKISRGNWQKHIKQIRTGLGLGSEGPVTLFSSETGQGKDELWSLIKQYISQ